MAILELVKTLAFQLDTWSLCIFLLILIISYQFLKNYKLPPGPYGLPYIGYGPFLSTARAIDVGKLCEKYKTDIISINIYGRLHVYLNTYDITKEVFQKRTDVVDRLDDASFGRLDPGYGGIIGSNGRFWREHRRFSISMLRDFGMGRIAAEKIIQNETQHLLEAFRSHEGKAFDPHLLTNMAVSNVICSIAFGKRSKYDDELFKGALDAMSTIMGPRISSNDHVTLLVRMIINLLPSWLNMLLFKSRIQLIFDCYKEFSSFTKLAVEEHRRTYNGTVNDLIDGYFKEMEKREGEEDCVFTDRQVQCLILDLFFAGSETTYTTLRWALLYMAAYPQIQERVHAELADVVGPGRMPEMSHKKSTPYTEAVLNEIQRFNTLVQFGVLHTNVSDDVIIKGYTVPRGTPVAANFHQIHRDPNTWKNPNEFDPNNFLHDGKVVNQDRLLQFSIGRRACVGEALARMELYIMFATFMKDFKVKLETDDTVPNLNGFHGPAYMPTPFKVRLEERFVKSGTESGNEQ